MRRRPHKTIELMILPLAKGSPIGGEARDAARGKGGELWRQAGRAAVLRLQPVDAVKDFWK